MEKLASAIWFQSAVNQADNFIHHLEVDMSKQIDFEIQGMTCNNCATHVQHAILEVPGVLEVNLPGWQAGRIKVTVEDHVESQALIRAVQQVGYRASEQIENALPELKVGMSDQTEPGGNQQFDLMVIGGGSAGFAAAIKAVEHNARVALVEANTIGGTCVNVGCVPSKTLIRAMENYHQAGTHRFHGVETSAGRLQWPLVIAHKDALVDEMRQAKYIDVLNGYSEITYIQGHARLIGGNQVEIDEKPYNPGKIVLTTGAKPWAPPIPGLYEAGYLTSTTAMELKELPCSMIVLGANAVGLELAQVFARAGVLVSVLELLPRIAPFEDEEISTALRTYLEEEGLQISTGVKIEQVERKNGRYLLHGTQSGDPISLDAEQLLVATGHRPNTANLGLEQAGVQLGQRKEVIVDKYLQTSNPHVYAAGDVTGQDMFVYVAAYSGGLAAENALNGSIKVYDASYIPRVTFTDPQIASAGFTEMQARQQGIDVKVSTLPMNYVSRSLAARDTRGLIKLVADTSTDKLLGAHILAPEAGEMIQSAVLAIRFGITEVQLRNTMFPYLTNVEGIKLAALTFEKDVAMLSCCAG
jgi:mercuric reductase